jgi:hypothetical protein
VEVASEGEAFGFTEEVTRVFVLQCTPQASSLLLQCKTLVPNIQHY